MSEFQRIVSILLLNSFVVAAPCLAANNAANTAANDAAKNSQTASNKASAEKSAHPEPDVNTAYTPLLLPDDAQASGISLSGETKMYKVSDGHFHQGCGCAMIHAEQAMHIDTCRANIYVRPGSTVVVGARTEATRVLNLSDRKHDSVRVVFGKTHISLNPGEELVVLNSDSSELEQAAFEYVIRYRNAQTIDVTPEYKAVLFEFSLADAMKHCLIFRQLTQSPKPQDKALLAEIIKTAAAVNTMFEKSRDKYTHGPNDPEAQPKKDGGTRIALKKKNNKRPRLAFGQTQSDND